MARQLEYNSGLSEKFPGGYKSGDEDRHQWFWQDGQAGVTCCPELS